MSVIYLGHRPAVASLPDKAVRIGSFALETALRAAGATHPHLADVINEVALLNFRMDLIEQRRAAGKPRPTDAVDWEADAQKVLRLARSLGVYPAPQPPEAA